jgi:signal transduction histidine kinase
MAGSTVQVGTLGLDQISGLPAFTGRSGLFNVTIGSDDYLGVVQPLDRAETGADRPVAIVLRSRTARLRFLGRLQRDIALAGLAAVLMATLIGYALARTVTRPLRAVTLTMRTMAATGNLAEATPAPSRWDDEDARLLSTTFHQLTTALDRFQREAAQRERLSSLGRLSTVIAHEVRNPLMIIKSAARTLRKHASPAVVGVAENIDEEVSRLNRVVTGVLDFARPIRFDLATADIGDLCRAAAHAVEAVPDHAAPIVVSAPAGLIVTDAERVRAVLVNLLSNAQQALAADPPARPTAPIRLRASSDGRRWRIEVADEGPGISPEHLPRLFEPFFTTRRTGSGLGLALARNVIEGLGGSMTVDSTLGVGTTVRIDLPDRTGRVEVSA